MTNDDHTAAFPDKLAEFRPAFAVFVRRTLIVGLVTLAVFAVIGAATGIWQILYVAPVLAVAYIFAFDDLQKWRNASTEVWTLTPDTLIHMGPEGEAHIPLAEITDGWTRFGWTVIVQLHSGLRVEMQYLRKPQLVITQILNTRNAMKV